MSPSLNPKTSQELSLSTVQMVTPPITPEMLNGVVEDEKSTSANRHRVDKDPILFPSSSDTSMNNILLFAHTPCSHAGQRRPIAFVEDNTEISRGIVEQRNDYHRRKYRKTEPAPSQSDGTPLLSSMLSTTVTGGAEMVRQILSDNERMFSLQKFGKLGRSGDTISTASKKPNIQRPPKPNRHSSGALASDMTLRSSRQGVRRPEPVEDLPEQTVSVAISSSRPSQKKQAQEPKVSGRTASTARRKPLSERQPRQARVSQTTLTNPAQPSKRSQPSKAQDLREWHNIPDFTKTLPDPGDMEFVVDKDSKIWPQWDRLHSPLDLTNDPERHLLLQPEIKLAETFRWEAKRYLKCKREIFECRVACLRNGKDFNKTRCQPQVNCDVLRTSMLFEIFDKANWFDPEHFQTLPEVDV